MFHGYDVSLQAWITFCYLQRSRIKLGRALIRMEMDDNDTLNGPSQL